MNMKKVKNLEKEKEAAEEVARIKRMDIFLKAALPKRIGTEEKTYSEQMKVHYLFDNCYRVNLWKNGKIVDSSFVVANEGEIISCKPELKKA